MIYLSFAIHLVRWSFDFFTCHLIFFSLRVDTRWLYDYTFVASLYHRHPLTQVVHTVTTPFHSSPPVLLWSGTIALRQGPL